MPRDGSDDYVTPLRVPTGRQGPGESAITAKRTTRGQEANAAATESKASDADGNLAARFGSRISAPEPGAHATEPREQQGTETWRLLRSDKQSVAPLRRQRTRPRQVNRPRDRTSAVQTRAISWALPAIQMNLGGRVRWHTGAGYRRHGIYVLGVGLTELHDRGPGRKIMLFIQKRYTTRSLCTCSDSKCTQIHET